MTIDKTRFGSFWNSTVNCYTLRNRGGITLNVIDYGAIIQALEVPGRRDAADIVLGFDTLYGYLKGHPFFGAVAGRVANRIPDGRFPIDGQNYQLEVNAPFNNHLHGGVRGFDKYVWQSTAFEEDDIMFVRLQRTSPDGEEGYPGRLDTTITYGLSEDNTLHFDVTATTSRPTIVNIVQHAYFNLAGHDNGNVCGHELTIHADAITPTDERLVPTGEIMAVADTPFDFRQPRLLAPAMEKTEGVFDVNYVLSKPLNEMKPCAKLYDPGSGRSMKIATNMPGVQFYNGHKISQQLQIGKNGCRYPAWAGLCLETQAFPNAVNIANFPSVVVRPGDVYRHQTSYAFDVE